MSVQRVGDISGQIEPLLSSFDEPTPLTAIPTNAMQLKRLDEEESSSIQIDEDDDDDYGAGRRGSDGRRGRRLDEDDDDDAKIPLLTSPEVISCVACDSIHRLHFVLISIQNIFFRFLHIPVVRCSVCVRVLFCTATVSLMAFIVCWPYHNRNLVMIYGFLSCLK